MIMVIIRKSKDMYVFKAVSFTTIARYVSMERQHALTPNMIQHYLAIKTISLSQILISQEASVF
jgi:hypothetical protein